MRSIRITGRPDSAFYYNEDSEWGQMVLELMEIVNKLTDPDRIYHVSEVLKILEELELAALESRRVLV